MHVSKELKFFHHESEAMSKHHATAGCPTLSDTPCTATRNQGMHQSGPVGQSALKFGLAERVRMPRQALGSQWAMGTAPVRAVRAGSSAMVSSQFVNAPRVMPFLMRCGRVLCTAGGRLCSFFSTIVLGLVIVT
jgi:hypothetical protein